MANIKKFSLTLDEVLRRASELSGKSQDADLVRWLGVSKSSLNNWKSRGTIPFKTLVPVLINKGVSLDWFFAPDQALRRPDISEGALAEQMTRYGAAESDDFVRLPGIIQELTETLQAAGAPVQQRQLNEMVALYRVLEDDPQTRTKVIGVLAKVFAEEARAQ
ncbi:bacteriophage CI repressor [Aliidiomarina halalkaliphila]|uniref:Bacteriophage CI repressor n=1 Tax=Aliidiomarina halalkaliphila TaxID=2593535 RepID=A0A552X2Y3_9GAMM|nr:helix-turn-helix domain-containing protein [Aliidiomarina halalkaliphila]TRW49388.1 bacteriophage CI repressor [Aliidiomarina halalkaliphila]